MWLDSPLNLRAAMRLRSMAGAIALRRSVRAGGGCGCRAHGTTIRIIPGPVRHQPSPSRSAACRLGARAGPRRIVRFHATDQRSRTSRPRSRCERRKSSSSMLEYAPKTKRAARPETRRSATVAAPWRQFGRSQPDANLGVPRYKISGIKAEGRLKRGWGAGAKTVALQFGGALALPEIYN
jgi:hypothetical protein